MLVFSYSLVFLLIKHPPFWGTIGRGKGNYSVKGGRSRGYSLPSSALEPPWVQIRRRVSSTVRRPRDVARILWFGGIILANFGGSLSEKNQPAAGSFNWSNTITHNFFETNLAKNISPSPKGLMCFISLGGRRYNFI